MGSQVSNKVAVTISPIVAAPVLKGVLNPLGDQITLTWTCATAAIDTFELFKNPNNNGFALYKVLPGTQFLLVDTITDDPVDDEDSALYYLIALKGAGISGPSNEVGKLPPPGG